MGYIEDCLSGIQLTENGSFRQDSAFIISCANQSQTVVQGYVKEPYFTYFIEDNGQLSRCGLHGINQRPF